MTSKHTTRPGVYRAFMTLAALCYVITTAIVPTGYMAAPVGSGSPVHLCPSDARSAMLMASLRSARIDHGAQQHRAAHKHHSAQGMGHGQDHGAAHGSGGEHSSDGGCPLAGPGAAAAGTAAALLLASALAPSPAPDQGRYRGQDARWLRPPARSPPA